ncbi:unnamed protein product [Arctia plantaginis]|uniref:Uncharacterized protein n=1 Tax=Arctia plantaginis TaxID=874455 RepID=A0A8S0Z6X2_ARCPL|nr:unnamed protein product [Arctia plantaginis]
MVRYNLTYTEIYRGSGLPTMIRFPWCFFSSVISGLRSIEMRGMSRTFAYLVPSNVIEVGFAAHKVSSNVTLPIGGGRIAY